MADMATSPQGRANIYRIPTAPIGGTPGAGTSGGVATTIPPTTTPPATTSGWSSGQHLDTSGSAWGSPPVIPAMNVTGPKGPYDPTGSKGYYNPLPASANGVDLTAYNAMITTAKAGGGTVAQQGASFDAQVQTAFLAQNPGVHTTVKPGDPGFWGSVYGQLVNGPSAVPVTPAPAGGNASTLIPAAVTTSPVSPQGSGTITATTPIDTGSGSAVTSGATPTTGAGGAFDMGAIPQSGGSASAPAATGTTAGMTTSDLLLIGLAAAGLLLTMHGRKGGK